MVPRAGEADRVRAAGGTLVQFADGKARVARADGRRGGVQVTRALGDRVYRGVIAKPDVAGPARLGGRDATLTLATDGVCDALSDEKVARVLRDTAPENHMGPKALIVAALDAGATDNVCALVVYLNRHA